MSLAIAILMKDPTKAKTRLSPSLGNDARESLAVVLFENTLSFFRSFHRETPVAVVTTSQRISAIATPFGVTTLAEAEHDGINGAARTAASWANSISASTLLVIHADIPTLAVSEIAQLIDAGKQHAVVIGQSYDGGTNALLVSPPDVIPFSFGPDSASRHERAASSIGQSCVRLRLPGLSRDVDTPADLATAALKSHADQPSFAVFAIPGIPEVTAGDDLAELIGAAVEGTNAGLQPGDIVIVAQKVVSKSEGRMLPLSAFSPSERALQLAEEIGKNPHKVEAILSESSQVIRARRQEPDGLLITRHRHGWICANAGIDESNLGEAKQGMLLLLPEDPDASARKIKQQLEQRFGGPIGVVVTDTFGRPWRNGLVNVAIGIAGVPAIVDWTMRTDAYGRGLKATLPAFADELAATAGLLMQKDAGLPVVAVRGLAWNDDDKATARDMLRPFSQELFV